MTEELKILISVVNKVSNEARQISEDIKNVADNAKQTGDIVSDLQNRLNNLANGLMAIGAAGLASFGAMLYAASQTASELVRLSKLTGIGTSEIMAMRGALADAEVNFEAIAHAIPRMSYGLMQLNKWDAEYLSKAFNLTAMQAYQVEGQIRALVMRLERAKASGASLGNQLLAVIDGLRGIQNESLRAAVAQILFRGAANDVLILTRYQTDELQRLIATYERAAPTDAAIAKLDEFGDAWSTLGTAVKGLFMEALAPLADALKPLIEDLTNLTIKFREFVAQHPTLAAIVGTVFLLGSALAFVVGFVMKIAVLVAALGGVGTVLTAIGSVVSTIVGVISSAVAAIGGVLSALVGAISLPVLAIIAIISALVAVGIWVWRNWDRVKGWLATIWDFIKSAWQKAISGITTALNWIIEKGRQLLAFFISLPRLMFEAGVRLILSLWQGIKSVINKPIEAVRSLVQRIRNYLPFSPAKEGALRDLPKAGQSFSLTFAEGIISAGGAIVSAVRETTLNALKPAAMVAPLYNTATPMAFAKAGAATTIKQTGYRYEINIVATSDAYVHEKVKAFLQKELPEILRRLVGGR